jgi:hypothetical protein
MPVSRRVQGKMLGEKEPDNERSTFEFCFSSVACWLTQWDNSSGVQHFLTERSAIKENVIGCEAAFVTATKASGGRTGFVR